MKIHSFDSFSACAYHPEVSPICLDATKCVFLGVFTLTETIFLKLWVKPMPQNAKSPLEVRRSKNAHV